LQPVQRDAITVLLVVLLAVRVAILKIRLLFLNSHILKTYFVISLDEKKR